MENEGNRLNKCFLIIHFFCYKVNENKKTKQHKEEKKEIISKQKVSAPLMEKRRSASGESWRKSSRLEDLTIKFAQ